MQLIVLDCDGVLSKGEAYPFDLNLFDRLTQLNQRARRDKAVPAVTLNTGRPSPYVEAVMQAIDGWQPALYENGAGLYLPQSYRFEATPYLTQADRTALQEIVSRLDQAIVQPGLAYWQPGKTVCYTLFTLPPCSLAELTARVEAIVTQVSNQFIVSHAKMALNIHPINVNKGTGLQWLAQVTDLDLADMGGVGDSAGDIDFLQLVGYPAAPLNAIDQVKAVSRFVASKSDAAGLWEILDHWSIP